MIEEGREVEMEEGRRGSGIEEGEREGRRGREGVKNEQ